MLSTQNLNCSLYVLRFSDTGIPSSDVPAQPAVCPHPLQVGLPSGRYPCWMTFSVQGLSYHYPVSLFQCFCAVLQIFLCIFTLFHPAMFSVPDGCKPVPLPSRRRIHPIDFFVPKCTFFTCIRSRVPVHFLKDTHSLKEMNPMLAKTPPMGWNSWDCYGAAVTEDIVRKNAEYMAQHLKQYGWEY